MQASIVGFSFSTATHDADYVPVGHRALDSVDNLRVETAIAALKPIFEDASIIKDGHDLKFDAIVLARHGVALRGLGLDTMLASYLIDATAAHPIEDLALEHTSYKALTIEDVCGKGGQGDLARGGACRRHAGLAGERADLVTRIAPITAGHTLDREQLNEVCRTTRPAARARAGVGGAGRCTLLGGRRRSLCSRAPSSRTSRSGPRRSTAWPAASSTSTLRKQLAEILFERLHCPCSNILAPRAPSTAVEVLEERRSPTRCRGRSSSGGS